MNFIKKHKVGLIVASVILILMILMFFGIKNAFFSNSKNGKYGNRLDGIENYPITDENINNIKTVLNDTGHVNSITYDLKGRIANFIIEVNDEVDLETSKKLADKVAENFSDEIKSFYDIQIYLISSNSESEIYPVIGYKNKVSDTFAWKVE